MKDKTFKGAKFPSLLKMYRLQDTKVSSVYFLQQYSVNHTCVCSLRMSIIKD